jgi:hypothetical protein
MDTTTFYKMDIHGIVYLIDPQTSNAYTYDLDHPVKIGKVDWKNPKQAATILLEENWKEILQKKMTRT